MTLRTKQLAIQNITTVVAYNGAKVARVPAPVITSHSTRLGTLGTREYSLISAPRTLDTREDSASSALGARTQSFQLLALLRQLRAIAPQLRTSVGDWLRSVTSPDWGYGTGKYPYFQYRVEVTRTSGRAPHSKLEANIA